MTFKVTVPNAAQSPGIFPGQNNINYDRLLKIINADHVFAFSFDAQQGMHKQCSLINRLTPVGSTSPASGILYSKDNELNWYNGSSNVQITPGTMAVTGTASVANTVEKPIFLKPSPDFSYVAYVWVSQTGSNIGNNSVVANHFTNGTNKVTPAPAAGAKAPIAYNKGEDLVFVNMTGATETFSWAALIIRLS